MADWLKVNHRLVRSAKIRQLANELRVKKHAALGAALCWLIWVDEQTTDGKTGLSPEDVDDELGFRGLAAALQSIGWASMEAGCLVATDFEKHCGATAKKRAEDNRRQNEKREKDRIKSREERDRCHGKSVTDVTGNALPEKNRIEYIDKEQVQEPNTTVDLKAPARPESAEEVEVFMRNQVTCGLDAGEVQTCATSFFDELEAVGWVNAKGVPVRNWQAMARSYLNKWQRNCVAGRTGGVKVRVRSEQKPNYDL